MSSSHTKEKNYRVVCICGGYGFPISASAARIIMVGKALQEVGIEFRVLHCGPSPILINDQRAGVYEGIPFVYTTPVKRPTNKAARLLVYCWGFLGLAFRLLQLWPVRTSTIIYLYPMDGALNLFSGGLCQLLGFPFAQELCEWFPTRPKFSSFNRWLYKRRFFKAPTGALVISKAIEQRVMERCEKVHPGLLIHRVGVMVDAQRFADASPLIDKSNAQHPNFVWCGTWLNDVLFLIRAFKLLRLGGTKCKLTIIGECGERNGLEILDYAKAQGLSSEDVFLAGCVEDDVLKASYKAATALLMPLWKDEASVTRLPNKMGEYLASGRPVITCRIGDLTEFLVDNVNAYVGEPGDEQDFANNMLRVLHTPEQAERIGMAGQQTCFTLLDYRAHASGLVRFFARCLENYNARYHPSKQRFGNRSFGTPASTDSPNDAHSVRVLGSRVHLLPPAKAVDQVECWVNAGERSCRRIVVTGFHGLLEADKDPKIRAILGGAELWVPDGIAPVLIARFRGRRNVQRTPGAEIMLEYFRRANQTGYSSYFYGGTNETLTALKEKLTTDYPGHKIAGVFAPPFRPLSQEEDKRIIDTINAAKPDVLWVGLGMPKQDIWIYERLDRLEVPVAIGVGAAFGFIGGTLKRCPEWIGRVGFEWAYRLAKEPRKLWRRDLILGPEFLFRLGLDLTGLRRSHNSALPGAD